ncbi:DUF4255 domain-containing protein [Paenibacillus contaminans]|uniref:DUF4255 domain-containing protein n=1 Tax=Paenibacillus contaminans TaxID=450362 RepID=A0A329MP50_9BACL|nr:DUF4255 domain-containing protein [Paenibacillus contaminans]RAV20503.1 DUF4255 domain-containing protein [Paenibacillus contaminans]
MADFTVIADVGASLLKLLREQMTPEPIRQPELIGLASPADKGDLSLSLYLYNIKENGEHRQTHMIKRSQDAIQYPPMTVDLCYLLTPHSTAELQVRALDEHRILGRAMQVIYDNAILRGSMLQGSLAEKNEEVRIVMDSIPAETLTRMWNFADNPYRLSVSYTVGPVNIDSNRIKTAKPVLERDIRIEG